MRRQLEFPQEVLRTTRLLARLLLWSQGELPLEPADALVIVRSLRAKLMALEQQANAELKWREVLRQPPEATSDGEAQDANESDSEIPW